MSRMPCLGLLGRERSHCQGHRGGARPAGRTAGRTAPPRRTPHTGCTHPSLPARPSASAASAKFTSRGRRARAECLSMESGRRAHQGPRAVGAAAPRAAERRVAEVPGVARLRAVAGLERPARGAAVLHGRQQVRPACLQHLARLRAPRGTHAYDLLTGPSRGISPVRSPPSARRAHAARA